jgi:hypothetical protein
MIHSSGIGESFGCSIAEGMFWRLPVIVDATPHADNAQVELVDHEVTGLVVQGVTGFVEAARRLAADADARRRLGEAGREKALWLYSETAAVRLWEKQYIELLDRAGCPAVSVRHRAHAAAVTAREPLNEADWPAEYQARLGRFSGPPPDWTEQVALRLASARDAVAYARQIGPRRVWGAVRDRLTAGRLFTRA